MLWSGSLGCVCLVATCNFFFFRWNTFPPSLPTMILTECVLIYMEPEKSKNVIGWFGERFSTALFLNYEPVCYMMLCLLGTNYFLCGQNISRSDLMIDLDKPCGQTSLLVKYSHKYGPRSLKRVILMGHFCLRQIQDSNGNYNIWHTCRP